MHRAKKAFIYGINGPIITVKNSPGLMITETVYIGNEKLIGEVIAINGENTIIQAYEETSGLRPGEPVESTGFPMSVTLGPGLIGNIFDGIQRPLKIIENISGDFITCGITPDSIDTEKEWYVVITVKKGDIVSPLSIIAHIKESPLIINKIMIPHGIKGEIIEIKESGKFKVNDVIARVRTTTKTENITMVSKWPIRKPRPYHKRKDAFFPLITGQRVIDTLFPIAKGGTASIPGGFGTGKTMTQHQIAKWSDAQIIIYVGCGERGNEMTQVLEEFSSLLDPKSKESLLNRTILIANTSNMPVAAREASIYTGITIAEYYRDMGYHVAVMADSTSRWAEALREISARLEEMPAEEGFPAYLSSRLSGFYERAGYVKNLNNTEGSISIIGAVSPQGGDFSEPVTQNTKRFTRCFWGLDKNLAYSRHYPAINWQESYSEYADELSEWYINNVDKNFPYLRKKTLEILYEERRLSDIVKLIGSDILPEEQKLVLEIANIIRKGFLQQNAYHPSDTYTSINEQFEMLETIIYLYEKCHMWLTDNLVSVSDIHKTGIFEKIIKMKYLQSDYSSLKNEIDKISFQESLL